MKVVVTNKTGLACLVLIWDGGREQLILLYFTVTGRAGSLGGELLCSLEWDGQSDLEVSRGTCQGGQQWVPVVREVSSGFLLGRSAVGSC